MTLRAKFSAGAPLGALFIAGILILDAWFLRLIIDRGLQAQQITLWTFVLALLILLSIPALVILIYQTFSVLSLRYRLDRNGVSIRWAGNEQVIPIRDIQQVIPGDHLGETIVRRRGLHWPGHERGDGLVPGIGRTRFHATRPLEEQLLLVTPGRTFGISPASNEAFLKAFQERKELGPNRLLDPEFKPARWSTWSIWTDQTAWILLGAAVGINLLLFGFLSARFPNLDLQLPLHFNSLGQVDRIGTKGELFALPIIGLIILGANLIAGLALYKRERAGSYLLWGAAATAQALFWLATFSLVP